jgi:hypothetical protein
MPPERFKIERSVTHILGKSFIDAGADSHVLDPTDTYEVNGPVDFMNFRRQSKIVRIDQFQDVDTQGGVFAYNGCNFVEINPVLAAGFKQFGLV